MKDLVSVIIPVYNRPKELQRAIHSVLNQTYQNFELLVVDDGSESDLKQICDSFHDERIRFLRNEKHTNANVARNRGIREAKGEYISMLDSDDEFLPIHLERRIEKIQEWNCDGIFGSAFVWNGDEKKIKLSRPLRDKESMADYLLNGGSAPTPSHFYKKDAVLDVIWDETLFRHQDYDFSIRFSEAHTFISDYQPTIIINWLKEEKRNIDLKSFINFYRKHEHRIPGNILTEYLWQKYNVASIEKDQNAMDFFYGELKKNIRNITPSQWIAINKSHSAISKIISLFHFIGLVFSQK